LHRPPIHSDALKLLRFYPQATPFQAELSSSVAERIVGRQYSENSIRDISAFSAFDIPALVGQWYRAWRTQIRCKMKRRWLKLYLLNIHS